jgi:hypothetical protein
VKLRLAGVLNWIRRCREDCDEAGRFRLRQESNAYAVLPRSQWRGFIEPDPPPLEPWQLGAAPPLPDPIANAVADHRDDDKLKAVVEGKGGRIVDGQRGHKGTKGDAGECRARQACVG